MELNRIETTLSAFRVGTSEAWSEDYVHAHAIASRKYPLAGMISHLMSHRRKGDAWKVAQELAKTVGTLDLAIEAIEFWLDPYCFECRGEGCHDCKGTGKKAADKNLKSAVQSIENTMQAMEEEIKRALTA